MSRSFVRGWRYINPSRGDFVFFQVFLEKVIQKVHVGEIAVRMMSAPSSNSRPRRSQTPKRTQTVFRRFSRGDFSIIHTASIAPAAMRITASASTISARPDASVEIALP